MARIELEITAGVSEGEPAPSQGQFIYGSRLEACKATTLYVHDQAMQPSMLLWKIMQLAMHQQEPGYSGHAPCKFHAHEGFSEDASHAFMHGEALHASPMPVHDWLLDSQDTEVTQCDIHPMGQLCGSFTDVAHYDAPLLPEEQPMLLPDWQDYMVPEHSPEHDLQQECGVMEVQEVTPELSQVTACNSPGVSFPHDQRRGPCVAEQDEVSSAPRWDGDQQEQEWWQEQQQQQQQQQMWHLQVAQQNDQQQQEYRHLAHHNPYSHPRTSSHQQMCDPSHPATPAPHTTSGRGYSPQQSLLQPLPASHHYPTVPRNSCAGTASGCSAESISPHQIPDHYYPDPLEFVRRNAELRAKRRQEAAAAADVAYWDRMAQQAQAGLDRKRQRLAAAAAAEVRAVSHTPAGLPGSSSHSGSWRRSRRAGGGSSSSAATASAAILRSARKRAHRVGARPSLTCQQQKEWQQQE